MHTDSSGGIAADRREQQQMRKKAVKNAGMIRIYLNMAWKLLQKKLLSIVIFETAGLPPVFQPAGFKTRQCGDQLFLKTAGNELYDIGKLQQDHAASADPSADFWNSACFLFLYAV